MIDVGKYWEPTAHVKLMRVPWDGKYSDVIDWRSRDRDEWFAAQNGITLDSVAYHRTGTVIRVNLPYPAAYTYNYLYVYDEEVPTTKSSNGPFFYFITNAEYVNPSTTAFTLQLDVWTTYIPTTTLQRGFLERGHLPMADTSATSDANIPMALAQYMDVNEGIDVGAEFRTYEVASFTLQTDSSGDYHDDWVVIMSTADLAKDPGTVQSPTLETAPGAIASGVYSGSSIYLVSRDQFTAFVGSCSSYTWVAQCIVSITVVPYAAVDSSNLSEVSLFGSSNLKAYQLPTSAGTDGTLSASIDIAKVSGQGWDAQTQAYSGLRKLWAYPYTVIELTAYGGQSVFLKPQLLPKNVTELHFLAEVVMPFARIGIYPQGYGQQAGQDKTYTISYRNADDNAGVTTIPYGDFLDTCLWVADLPQWSIVNNSYITYLASTTHTRAYNYQSADWALRSSNMSTDTSYALASKSLDTTKNLQRANMIAQGVGMVTGAVGSMVSRDWGGALSGVINDGTSMLLNNYSNQQNNALSQYTMDANRDLANSLSQGNYDLAVAGIQAGVQDAALSSPSTVGSMGGEGFRYAHGLLFAGSIKYKRVSDDAIVRAGQYFKRFGYKVDRYVSIPQDHLNIMTRFTYWKFIDLQLTSAQADEGSKDVIRAIFAQGVTVWDDPAMIGRVMIQYNDVNEDRKGAYL